MLGANASKTDVVKEALDELCVVFGKEILKLIPGRVSTEVDARLSFDTDATIEKARKIIAKYNADGISNDRVLIKIASTWEGIKAAEVLEKENIHCNLTLLFNFYQAVACAEAGVTLISPFVGRILDWYKSATGRDSYPATEDPGVVSVTKIFNFFKSNGYKTEVMGASFRNIEEITELAGCDLLTISPKLLQQLNETHMDLPIKLNAQKPLVIEEKIHLDQTSFELMMAGDKMATEKLDDGISGFSKAIDKLENQLNERLELIEGGVALTL
jgi:transaldolase